MRNILFSLGLFIFLYACSYKKELQFTTLRYSVAAQPWEQVIGGHHETIRSDSIPSKFPASVGNHRAIIEVPVAGEAAYLNLEWRRHDSGVGNHRFILVNTQTKDTVQNIYRVGVTGERCELVFGPVNAGKYYFYYLPYEIQGGWGGYNRNYLPKELPPNANWLKRINVNNTVKSNYVEAKLIEIQARTKFDSFYPMEVIATQKEKDSLIALNNSSFLLFPEDRKYPIRMLDNIPQKWVINPLQNLFEGTACRNEYYVLQIGLWALQDISDVKVDFTSLKGEKFTIPDSSMTCFNIGGIDPFGKPFIKIVNVARNKVQPLWMGVDIPNDIPSGIYTGKVTIGTKNAGQKEIELKINVTNDVLADRGDSETWRYSRLRWLNSTAGIDNHPIPPYEPIEIQGKDRVMLSGKALTFGENGLPSSISVWGQEVLSSPIRYTLTTEEGKLDFTTQRKELLGHNASALINEIAQSNEYLDLITRSEVWCDGYLKYTFRIKIKKGINLKDIRLEIPYKKEISEYMVGMGLPGKNTPDSHEGKWDILHDTFWVGDPKAGLSCELLGAPYSGPLLMFYNTAPPPSWYNEGKGGFRISTVGDERKAIAFSGKRDLRKGDTLQFQCAFVITPVKKLNTYSQFHDRYYHNPLAPEPKESDVAKGIKIINVHQGNKYNPHINYPFLTVKKLKDFVDYWHKRGMKVKLYYTVRELSDFTTELWALRSLGDEILANGDGGGYPWLREHLVSNYKPQWYQYLDSVKGADAAIMTSPGNTRWYNYYVEGIKWLVKEEGIDGLYIDAGAYGRDMIMRMRKVMNEVKPGCMFDLHAGTYGGPPVLQYTEFFPYLDKLWFGELYNYNKMPPANWLVEVSGIPFGLMGDMLPLEQAGGESPWRGMVYGMTSRLPYTDKGLTDPSEIWKIWDRFGIVDAKMVGYWSDSPVVTTSDKNVLATAYVKNKKILISLASWAKEDVDVKLNIDFGSAGIDPEKISITAPLHKRVSAFKDFQNQGSYSCSAK